MNSVSASAENAALGTLVTGSSGTASMTPTGENATVPVWGVISVSVCCASLATAVPSSITNIMVNRRIVMAFRLR